MEDLMLFLEYTFKATVALWRDTTEGDLQITWFFYHMMIVGIVAALRGGYLELVGRKGEDGAILKYAVVTLILLTVFASCTETVVEPHYTTQVDTVTVVDTVLYPGQVAPCIVKTRVLDEGANIRDAVVVVVSGDTDEFLGAMVWRYPDLIGDSYGFILPTARPLKLFVLSVADTVPEVASADTAGADIRGRSFFGIEMADFRPEPYHNGTIYIAHTRDFILFRP